MNIAEKIFLTSISQMKEILELGEFKFGIDSKEYKFFKKKTMDAFYRNMSNLFRELENENVLRSCKCESNLRHGYTDCPNCHGAGYVNKS